MLFIEKYESCLHKYKTGKRLSTGNKPFLISQDDCHCRKKFLVYHFEIFSRIHFILLIFKVIFILKNIKITLKISRIKYNINIKKINK